VIARLLLKNNLNPVIIVDWSNITPCGNFLFLRASITSKGRTLPLYDQAYGLDECYKDETHRQFLKTLKTLLPETFVPIIVTDAGFRNTWFKAVLDMGWDFIGRVRNRTHYWDKALSQWLPVKNLYPCASTKSLSLGRTTLAKANPIFCEFYIVRNKKKYRTKRNLAGKKIQGSSSKRYQKCENEPWLLVSSISPSRLEARDIILIYKKRMQIEESFRDLKNTKQGFGLRHCRSFCAKRFNIALLIACLATLVLWIVGTAAKLGCLHYSFQSNTEKKRAVLSTLFIGWQVLHVKRVFFSNRQISDALKFIIDSAKWRAS